MTTPIKRLFEDINLRGMLLKLKEEGECDGIITNQLAAFKKTCTDALKEAVIHRIDNAKDLAEVDYFLEVLDKEIEKEVNPTLPIFYQKQVKNGFFEGGRICKLL